MKWQIPINIKEILICPQCKGNFEYDSNGMPLCISCNVKYDWSETGSLDLRLKRPQNFNLMFELGKLISSEEIPLIDTLPMNPIPSLSFRNTYLPHHLSRELLSYFPQPAKNGLMLDLGCGDTIHREVCEQAGFNYIGLDFENPKAPILGDAHALPFKEQSIEFILSVAVLEHIQFPFVMMKEAFRILKPGGVFIGTVSFLEPFHGNSFYHHTQLGVYNTLRYGGFEVDWIAASQDWLVFDAQARMSAWAIFPRMPQFLSNAILLFPKMVWKLWWKIGGYIRSTGKLNKSTSIFAGSFSFLARKR